MTVVIVPIVVAACRALIRGWSPLGDSGILVVRAADVLTRHNPLLGSWTSASIASGQPVNNPGPLYFDLIALPVKLLGHSVGLAVGVALVNVAALTFVVLASERLAGRTAMLSITVVTVLLEWSMGSELLFDVWQPNALVLPGLAFMVSAWALASGRVWYLPVVVGIGSLLVQTHLSYVYLVPITILGGILFATATGSISEPVRRPMLVAAGVGLMAWIQPIIEQFSASGEGNLTSLLDASRNETHRFGARLGVRLLAEVLTVPPFWGRPSYEQALPPRPMEGAVDDVPVVSLTSAGLGLVVLIAALVATTWWHHRRHRTVPAALAAISLCLLAGCLLSLTLMPVGVFGLSSHQMRWIWPVGAMATAALLITAPTMLGSLGTRLRYDIALVAFAALIAVLALPTYAPTQISSSGPTAQRAALPTAQELGAQLGALEGRGTVLFDLSTITLFDPYNGYLFAQLQDRGIPFVFEDEATIRQLGEGRRYRGDADLRIWLETGPDALADELPVGVERVALAGGPSEDETAELADLEQRLHDEAAQNGLALNAAGRAAVGDGQLPRTALDPEPGQHPFEAIGNLDLAVEEGWIDYVGDQLEADFKRLIELENQRFFGAVALLASPVDVRPRPD